MGEENEFGEGLPDSEGAKNICNLAVTPNFPSLHHSTYEGPVSLEFQRLDLVGSVNPSS